MREWIIFALCMGAAGHIVLGIVLHAPESWPWQQAGPAALAVGVGLYVSVLIARTLVRLVRTASARR